MLKTRLCFIKSTSVSVYSFDSHSATVEKITKAHYIICLMVNSRKKRISFDF